MKCKFGRTKSPKLVYCFVKLIGLAPFTLSDKRFDPPTRLSVLYSVIVAVSHLLLTTMSIAVMMLQFGEVYFQETVKIWGIAQYVVSLPATFSTIVSIILYRKKITCLMNEFCDVSNKFKTLKVEEKTENFFNHVIVIIAISNAIIVTTCVIAGVLESNWLILNSIGYGVGSWFNLNVLLIYIQVMSYIRQHFKQLNDIVSEKFYFPTDRFELIRKVEALHSDLYDLLNRVTDVFALPILLNSFQFFCVIVISGQWIYTVIKFSSPSTSSQEFFSFGAFGIWSPLLRMVIVVGEILTISYTSATTCHQGNSIRERLIDISNVFTPVELQDEFFMFSIQLADEPVAISIFGIFDIDYSYVHKIFGSAITYVAVIVQFGGERLNPYLKK